jgi:hypothetical protein
MQRATLPFSLTALTEAREAMRIADRKLVKDIRLRASQDILPDDRARFNALSRAEEALALLAKMKMLLDHQGQRSIDVLKAEAEFA